jgi:hypothetical protein
MSQSSKSEPSPLKSMENVPTVNSKASSPKTAGRTVNPNIPPVPSGEYQRIGEPLAWEYRSSWAPGERAKTYKMFQSFLDMGWERNIKSVALMYNVHKNTVYITAKKWKWVERAQLFDDYHKEHGAEAIKKARHDEHLKKLEEFRERTESLGSGLVTSGARLLQIALKSIAEMQANGETLDRRLISGALQAAAKVAETGRTLSAASIGVDEILNALNEDEEVR